MTDNSQGILNEVKTIGEKLISELKLNTVSDFFKEIDDNYYEKAQKISIYEIGNAFAMAIKEKELEIAEVMVKRKVSKV